MLYLWVKKFGTGVEFVNIDSETNQTIELKEAAPDENIKIKALEKALANANLKIVALETMIDIAEEELNIEIRKKSGSKQL